MRPLALALLALPVLQGCGFGVPLKQPTVVPEQAERSRTIRLGEATRSDVREALGAPRLESDYWRVEVYESEDKRTELEFLVVIVLPVPMGVSSEKRRGHVLVAYDAEGLVSEVSSGSASDGSLATGTARWMAIRAGEFWFVVDPVGTRQRSTLLADASRLREYLEARSGGDGCTLVASCDPEGGCPDTIAVDGGEPLDPSSLDALCAPDGPCPEGARLTETVIDGSRLVRVPVVHATALAPGRHSVRVSSTRIKGGGAAEFGCAPGEVVHATIRTRAVGASWWSKGTLEATVTFSPVAPEGRASRSVVLVRDGRWVVERAP